jgi:peptidoglycan/LPS O-acetylase OafA/YrhL
MTETRLRGLDGLRALCAIFLLLGHIPQSDFADWTIPVIPIPVCCAYVFFIISGFLAGYRLDCITSVRDYYKKKAKRILPLYYSFILLSIIVYSICGKADDIINPSIWYYLLLIPGIPFCTKTGILPFVHLWFIGSLVLFYIVFPIFARFIRSDRTVLAAAVVSFLWFCLRIGIRIILGKDSFLYRFAGITSFDILFLGVIGGIIEKKEFRVALLMKEPVINIVLSISAWLLFLFSGVYEFLIPAPIRTLFISVLSLIIISTQLVSHPIPNIDIPILKWIGGFSYEFYVIHILLIILLSSLYSRTQYVIPWPLIYLICIMVTIGCAWAFNKVLLILRCNNQTRNQ